jgi:hypothetical protein
MCPYISLERKGAKIEKRVLKLSVTFTVAPLSMSSFAITSCPRSDAL